MPPAPAGAAWVDPAAAGTIASGKGTNDVKLKWGDGPNIGRPVYQVNASYVWDLEVNVVQVLVETPTNAFTPGTVADNGVYGQYKNVTSAGAPQKKGLAWQAKVTLNGPADPNFPNGGRGIK